VFHSADAPPTHTAANDQSIGNAASPPPVRNDPGSSTDTHDTDHKNPHIPPAVSSQSASSTTSPEKIEKLADKTKGPGPSEWKTALQLYSRACDLGMARSCYMFADMKVTEAFPKKPPEAAKQHFARSCDLGYAEACYKVVHLRADTILAKNLSSDDVRLLQKACDGGSGNACDTLATLYDATLPKSDPKPFAYANRACDLKSESGCTALGTYYYYGDHTVQDYSAARAAWQRACAGGEFFVCDWLKQRYFGRPTSQ
jgi:TPR repeat protein